MKVLKSVNLHLEYVPRCFRNQNAKKVEHKVTSKKQKQKKNKKKKYGRSSRHTRNEKVGKWFINYYHLTVKVKKNNGTFTVLMSNYVSDMIHSLQLHLEANVQF